MTEEEYFRKNYPDSCYGDKPLSPHWDFFQDGVEFGERQSAKKIEDLEKENAELKCECRRCVYTDSPCVLSDYGKDRNGICNHFKDVFEELTITDNECKDMREELKQRIRENQNLCEQIEKMKCCATCDNNKEEHTPEEYYRCKTCKKFCNWELED